jgi:hypothetical protein
MKAKKLLRLFEGKKEADGSSKKVPCEITQAILQQPDPKNWKTEDWFYRVSYELKIDLGDKNSDVSRNAWVGSFKDALHGVNDSDLADLGGGSFYKAQGSTITVYVMSDRCIDLEDAEGTLEGLEVLFKKWFDITKRVETKMRTAKGKA